MGRYTEASCRLCRRVGEKLFLKGERCFSPKCAVERRGSPPGDHPARRRRVSERGVQLKEKQKARYTYGMMERQFRNYYEAATRVPGVTGLQLLQMLERRLDNVVYRMGYADSRKQARQLVRHGQFVINNTLLDIPSYLVNVGDEIAWKEAFTKSGYFAGLAETMKGKVPPPWLSLDPQTLKGKVLSLPQPTEVDTRIQDRLIVEYYSR